jgi:hypothetical protein
MIVCFEKAGSLLTDCMVLRAEEKQKLMLPLCNSNRIPCRQIAEKTIAIRRLDRSLRLRRRKYLWQN